VKVDDRLWFWVVFGMCLYSAIAGNDISIFVCTMAIMLFIEYWAKEIIKNNSDGVDDEE